MMTETGWYGREGNNPMEGEFLPLTGRRTAPLLLRYMCGPAPHNHGNKERCTMHSYVLLMDTNFEDTTGP